jgi:hypothetical protein
MCCLRDLLCILTLQVALNQLALAPVTLAAVFTWNSVLTGQSEAIPGKIQRDLVPSMLNGDTCRGWKAWVQQLMGLGCCASPCICHGAGQLLSHLQSYSNA